MFIPTQDLRTSVLIILGRSQTFSNSTFADILRSKFACQEVCVESKQASTRFGLFVYNVSLHNGRRHSFGWTRLEQFQGKRLELVRHCYRYWQFCYWHPYRFWVTRFCYRATTKALSCRCCIQASSKERQPQPTLQNFRVSLCNQLWYGVY